MWTRLEGGKREAKKLWAEGREIALLPRNLRPGMMWQPMPVTAERYLDRAEHYQEMNDRYPSKEERWSEFLSRPAIEVAWDLMYNNWYHYNANSECGYYAHYYVRSNLVLQTDALNFVWRMANNALRNPQGREYEALEQVRDFLHNLMTGGSLSDRQKEINGAGIELQFAILYQDGYYEEEVYRVPGTSRDMPYAQLNEIGQRYVNELPVNDNIFGCYLTGIPEA